MDEVLALREYLYERTGIYLPDGRRYLFEGQFAARMEALGLSHMAQYLAYLRKQEQTNGELTQLLNSLDVGAMSFFDDPVRFRALGEVFVPELVRLHNADRKEVRIWCVGCGTGEHAYAAAMALWQRQGDLLKGWTCQVWGTDRSNSALSTAREGLYREFAVRGLPKSLADEHMISTGEQVRVRDELKGMVRFEQFDLTQLLAAGLREQIDIVFCSNELAHFGRQQRAEIVAHLYQAMRWGGYLVLGNLESLRDLRNGFRLVHFRGGFAYRKLPSSG
ncbi:MAG: CheR family methyltransferase [Candidatus Oleimicrobiaceae bacterium]